MVSPEALPARRAPLRADADGTVRIGATRVTLDTLVGAFMTGCTAEEIVTKYPSLDLADVYAVIDAKPITGWSNRDEASQSVARGIRAAAEELAGR